MIGFTTSSSLLKINQELQITNNNYKDDKNSGIYLKPLTLPYHDNNDFYIQLWETSNYGLIGSVRDHHEHITILSGTKIRNPLNPSESSQNLVSRLEKEEPKIWHLAFEVATVSLTIWPHLEAAGKGEKVRAIRIKGSPVRYTTEEALMDMLHFKTTKEGKLIERGFVQKPGDPNAWINEKRGIEIHFDRPGEGNNQNEPQHIDVKFLHGKGRELPLDSPLLDEKTKQKYAGKLMPSRTQLERDRRLEFYKNLLDEKKAEFSEKVKRGEISQREASKQLNRFENKLKLQNEQYQELRVKWRFVYGEKRPVQDPDNNHKSDFTRSPPAPGESNFKQYIQQTDLATSYNSTHLNNPISAQATIKRQIGGVACSIDYIKDLFDTPDSLFEEDHFFCLPELSNGQLPFSDQELRQILRELAIGIFTHSTVPFFSLHFREGTLDLFPVIHPAYENTLVGRVIAMLDYIMKGYLNGGVYSEEFLDQWHKDPNWNRKSASALQQLIDFVSYCEEHLEGKDKHYDSVADLRLQIDGFFEGMKNVPNHQESKELGDFSGFKNSFRIIAKQNSFQKDGNLFVIDSDFDGI